MNFPYYPGVWTPPAPPVKNPQAGRVFPASAGAGADAAVPVGGTNSYQVIFAATAGTIFQDTASVIAANAGYGSAFIRHYDNTSFVIDVSGNLGSAPSVSLVGYNSAWTGPEALDFIYSRLHAPEHLVDTGNILVWTYPWKIHRTMMVNPRVPGSPPQDCVIIERIYPTGPIATEETRLQYRRNAILGTDYYGKVGGALVPDAQHPPGMLSDVGLSEGMSNFIDTDNGNALRLLLNIESYFYPGSEGSSLLPARVGKIRAVMPLAPERTEHEIVPFGIPGYL